MSLEAPAIIGIHKAGAAPWAPAWLRGISVRQVRIALRHESDGFKLEIAPPGCRPASQR
jgi:hypothetical protein